MGRPQLGFPRLRIGAGRAAGVAIGPDHTPPSVTVRRILAQTTHGLQREHPEPTAEGELTGACSRRFCSHPSTICYVVTPVSQCGIPRPADLLTSTRSLADQIEQTGHAFMADELAHMLSVSRITIFKQKRDAPPHSASVPASTLIPS